MLKSLCSLTLKSTYAYVTIIYVSLSPDSVSDRVQGEYPWRGAEGAAPQHGL